MNNPQQLQHQSGVAVNIQQLHQNQAPITIQDSFLKLEETLIAAVDLCHTNATMLENWQISDQSHLWSNIDRYISTLGDIYDTAERVPMNHSTTRETLLVIDSGVNPLSVLRSQVDASQHRQDLARGQMAQAEIFRESFDNLLAQWLSQKQKNNISKESNFQNQNNDGQEVLKKQLQHISQRSVFNQASTIGKKNDPNIPSIGPPSAAAAAAGGAGIGISPSPFGPSTSQNVPPNVQNHQNLGQNGSLQAVYDTKSTKQLTYFRQKQIQFRFQQINVARVQHNQLGTEIQGIEQDLKQLKEQMKVNSDLEVQFQQKNQLYAQKMAMYQQLGVRIQHEMTQLQQLQQQQQQMQQVPQQLQGNLQNNGQSNSNVAQNQQQQQGNAQNQQQQQQNPQGIQQALPIPQNQQTLHQQAPLQQQQHHQQRSHGNG